MEIQLFELCQTHAYQNDQTKDQLDTTINSPSLSHQISRSPSPNQEEANRIHNDEDNLNTTELAPIDGGHRAWIFLVSAFITEMICLGGAFSFSIFQDFLVQSPHSPIHKADNVSISAIGTLLVCSSYFAPALLRAVWSRFANWNRMMGFACLQLAGISLVIASFSNSIGFLLVFMGVLPGILLGLGTLNYLIWLPQWFLKMRGLANGIAFAGAGTGGIIYPFILSTALHQVGFQWTMRIWAAIIIIIGGVSSLLLQPRLPVNRHGNTAVHLSSAGSHNREQQQTRMGVMMAAKQTIQKFKYWLQSMAFLVSPLLMLNALTTFLASMSFFAVSFYLAVYCASLGLTPGTSTGIVAAFNAAALTGEVVVGHACDRFAYPSIMLVISMTGSLSAFLLFGLAHSLVGVVFFVLLFGMAAGSWCSVWTPAAYDISRLHNMQTANVLLTLTLPRGLAAAVGPLIAASLYEPERNTAKAIFGAYGFGGLVGFVGGCMGGVVVVVPVLWWVRVCALHGGVGEEQL